MTWQPVPASSRPVLRSLLRAIWVALPGVAAVGYAAAGSPTWSRALLVPAVATLAASTLGRWPWTGTATAAAAVALAASTAVTRTGGAGAAALAVDGLLVLAYLLTLDAVEASRGAGAVRATLRGHLPTFAAAAAAAAVAALAATLPTGHSVLLAVAGAAALAAAYWLAVCAPVEPPGDATAQPPQPAAGSPPTR